MMAAREAWDHRISAALAGAAVSFSVAFLAQFTDRQIAILGAVTGALALLPIIVSIFRRILLPWWYSCLSYRCTRFCRARLATEFAPIAAAPIQTITSLETIPIGQSGFLIELRPKEPIEVDGYNVRFVWSKTEKEGSPSVSVGIVAVLDTAVHRLDGQKLIRGGPELDKRGGCSFTFSETTTIPAYTSHIYRVIVEAKQQWWGGYLSFRFNIKGSTKPYFVRLPACTLRSEF